MTELIDLLDSLGFWIYFPILILIAIPMMRFILRMGSDDDDDDEDGEEIASSYAVIPRRKTKKQEYTGARLSMNREKYGRVVRGLYDHDPNIITQKLKIKNDDTTEPILCPNCGISVMTQWQKCYRCGELL